jgi:hypothetical protein
VPRNVHLYSPNCTYIVADGPPLPYPIVENARIWPERQLREFCSCIA